MGRILSRRNFLALSGAGVVGLIASQSLGGKKVRYRIVTLPDVEYPPGFLKLAQNKSFRSVEHALRSVCDPEVEFAIEEVAPSALPVKNLNILGTYAPTKITH